MLVDSGATDDFFDDKLIPGLADRMTDNTLLDTPKMIVTVRNRELRGTATGILCGTIVDRAGREHRVRFPAFIVPGLGRSIFSPAPVMKRGVTTILEETPHLRKGDVVVPLQQQGEDIGLCSCKAKLDRASSSPAIAPTAQVSADVWHRRLGHMNPRNMHLLR